MSAAETTTRTEFGYQIPGKDPIWDAGKGVLFEGTIYHVNPNSFEVRNCITSDASDLIAAYQSSLEKLGIHPGKTPEIKIVQRKIITITMEAEVIE
jgi:hypothetical protein